MHKKILIAEPVHPILTQRLQAVGYECVQVSLTAQELKQAIGEYEGIIIRSKIIIDSDLINAARNLQWIGRTGSGMENVDTVYAAAKGIVCINSPEGNCDAVAEHTIALMINLLKNITRAGMDMRQGQWTRSENIGTELGHQTVGLYGYGHTGSAVARRLEAFGCKVLVYDKYKSGFGTPHISECTPQRIFEEANVVSLHVPLTDETHHLANEAWFARFHHPIVFINVCRGGVTQTAALLQALEQRKVWAAGLDVFENEEWATLTTQQKTELEALRKRTDVWLTPHIAGVTHDSYYKMSVILANKIIENIKHLH